MASSYSTKNISQQLVEELVQSIRNIKGWGSIEIFIQDYNVTQITEKNIKKSINNSINANNP